MMGSSFEPIRKLEERKIVVGRFDGSVKELVFGVSEGVVQCVDDESETPPSMLKIQLQIASATGEVKNQIGEIEIGFRIKTTCSTPTFLAPAKPHRLLSVQNSWEVLVHAIEYALDGSSPRPVITRTPIRFDALGWEFIEVYPNTAIGEWKPKYALMWAETDILAATLACQAREIEFRSLDPYADARLQKAKVLDEYRALLDSNPDREEVLQQYLTVHPELLCATYIRCKPKVPFGDTISDFVFRNAAGDYLLVELEKSTTKLFLSGKRECDPSAELNHARSQIGDWKRYIEDNLTTVQRELDLPGMTTNPRSLIVMGRRSSLTANQIRKLATMENDSPRTTILTYDDVLVSAKAAIENILGPLGRDSGQTKVCFPGTR